MPSNYLDIDAFLLKHQDNVRAAIAQATKAHSDGAGYEGIRNIVDEAQRIVDLFHKDLEKSTEKFSANGGKIERKVHRYLATMGVDKIHRRRVIWSFVELEHQLLNGLQNEISLTLNPVSPSLINFERVACWRAILVSIEALCIQAKARLSGSQSTSTLPDEVELFLLSHFGLIALLTHDGWSELIPPFVYHVAIQNMSLVGEMYSENMNHKLGRLWNSQRMVSVFRFSENLPIQDNAESRSQRRKFLIGLSFARERRAFVEKASRQLDLAVGSSSVFYDRSVESLADPSLYPTLPNTLAFDCEIIVVFLCAQYLNRDWCKREWDAIRSLRGTPDASRIMFVEFRDISESEKREIGVYSTDSVFPIKSDTTPEEVANQILYRLRSAPVHSRVTPKELNQ